MVELKHEKNDNIMNKDVPIRQLEDAVEENKEHLQGPGNQLHDVEHDLKLMEEICNCFWGTVMQLLQMALSGRKTYTECLKEFFIIIFVSMMTFRPSSSRCNPKNDIVMQIRERKIWADFKNLLNSFRAILYIHNQLTREVEAYSPAARIIKKMPTNQPHRKTLASQRRLILECDPSCRVYLYEIRLRVRYDAGVLLPLPLCEGMEHISISAGVFSETADCSDYQVFIVDASQSGRVYIWWLSSLKSQAWIDRMFETNEPSTGASGLIIHNNKLWWVSHRGSVMCVGTDEQLQKFPYAPMGHEGMELYLASLVSHGDCLYLVRTRPYPMRCYKIVQEGERCDDLHTLNGRTLFILEGKGGFFLNLGGGAMMDKVFTGLTSRADCECYDMGEGDGAIWKTCSSEPNVLDPHLCSGCWLPPSDLQ